GAEILTRMEAAYGPKDKWGALLKDPMMEILEAHPNAVFDLSEEFIERMFRFEQKVHAQVKYGDQWVTHRMANIAKEFWDPSSDLTRHYRKTWGSVDNVIASVYRFIERRR